MKIYPADFVPAKICYNCYGLFGEFCIKRQNTPTKASIHKFGCDRIDNFNPINKDGEHNCLNCKSFRKNYCINKKEVIKNIEEEKCNKFMCRPYFVERRCGDKSGNCTETYKILYENVQKA